MGDFWCGTEGGGTERFLVLNGGVSGLELRVFWGLKSSGLFEWN